MPSINLKENEYFDSAMRRFKRACEKAGILTELRKREFYEKPTMELKDAGILLLIATIFVSLMAFKYLFTNFFSKFQLL